MGRIKVIHFESHDQRNRGCHYKTALEYLERVRIGVNFRENILCQVELLTATEILQIESMITLCFSKNTFSQLWDEFLEPKTSKIKMHTEKLSAIYSRFS